MSRKKKKYDLSFPHGTYNFFYYYNKFINECYPGLSIRDPSLLGNRRRAKLGGWLKERGFTMVKRQLVSPWTKKSYHEWALEATNEEWHTYYLLTMKSDNKE